MKGWELGIGRYLAPGSGASGLARAEDLGIATSK